MTKKSGLADSPFFIKPQPQPQPSKTEATPLLEKFSPKKKKSQIQKETGPTTVVSHHHGTMQPSNHDTTVSWYHDTIIELLRKTVKIIGKEAATHRFTVEEKRAIKKIVFTYEDQGILTSENEITRIAINHLIEDYKQNGKSSLLDRVLKALNR
ncbi:MAG: hypothetical protein H6657_22840 [Ardenticatenaceae bacterium]|nr:hypothetical protein [Ardenticatenaceae bacterium]